MAGLRPGSGRLIVLFALAAALSSCTAVEGLFATPESALGISEAAARSSEVSVTVLDESGLAIGDVTFTTQSEAFESDESGVIRFAIDQPVAGVLTKSGFLPEPYVVDPTQADFVVTLLSREAPDGSERAVHHYAGDVMLGRRYFEPTRSDTAVVDPDDPETARDVVRSVGALFGAADLSVVNLETVVGDLPVDQAYPGKRFLLSSHPVVLDLLDELSVDVVTLGNNHLNDWEQSGIEQTLGYLDGAGIERVGGGLTRGEAEEGRLVQVGSVTVGMLSYTTVTGDFVNDSLPEKDDPVPDELDPGEAWQYEERSFEYGELISSGERRIGEMWSVYESVAEGLDEDREAELWAAVRAVYPELQDWVARRGHGGAAWYRRSVMEKGVADLREQGADLVVVQLHAGFQFSVVPSSFVRSAARASVDAGADLVIGHHPHVLQGFETYRGKLIAYSLGNFVFDQNFLSTFPSVFLRTVFEGNELIEARIYPLVLDGYRPVPLAGDAAHELVEQVDARTTSAYTTRRVEGSVRTVTEPEVVEGVGVTRVFPDNNSGLIVVDAEQDESSVGDEPRQLFAWGDFEDATADGAPDGGTIWDLADANRRSLRVDDAPSGSFVLAVRSGPRSDDITWARPVARLTRADHNVFTPKGEPVDGAPVYQVRLKVRAADGVPMVRFDVYHFDDSDPNVDPVSDLVRRVELDLDVPADGEWHDSVLDLPGVLFSPVGNRTTNAAMLYLGVRAEGGGPAEAHFDLVEVVEIRAVSG